LVFGGLEEGFVWILVGLADPMPVFLVAPKGLADFLFPPQLHSNDFDTRSRTPISHWPLKPFMFYPRGSEREDFFNGLSPFSSTSH